MENYPVEATEKFDDAKFHRKYCMSFIKKFIQGEVLEVGAGCGSFTRDYFNNDLNITLTETDQKNYEDLKKFFNDIKEELKSAHWLWWVGLFCLLVLNR